MIYIKKIPFYFKYALIFSINILYVSSGWFICSKYVPKSHLLYINLSYTIQDLKIAAKHIGQYNNRINNFKSLMICRGEKSLYSQKQNII